MPSEIRWAFNASAWQPCKQQIFKALSSISNEEIERIERFRFKKDYKLSLIGRLMIRKCIRLVLGVSWGEIILRRTEKGKPTCENRVLDRELFFNVSHHGDYTVLAASNVHNIGVDVMKFSLPNNIDIPAYFRLMNRQFVQSEWDYIRYFENDCSQLKAFYRLWCLKESYVKAVGSGIGTESADTMRFHINTKTLSTEGKCSDSILYIDDIKTEWIFSECLLDDEHVVTVATESNDSNNGPLDFEHITFEELVDDSETVTETVSDWWGIYEKKCEKT